MDIKTTRYDSEPPAVLLDEHRGMVHFTVSAHARQLDDGQWEAVTASFWVPEGELNPADVAAHPDEYLHYVTAQQREGAREEAQRRVDAVRGGCPVVPVPHFRPGAAVCHRPEDDTKMLGGAILGGLPAFELADGSIVPLSVDDIKTIMQDVAAWEYAVQNAKRAAWDAIAGAASWDEVTAALDELDAALAALKH